MRAGSHTGACRHCRSSTGVYCDADKVSALALVAGGAAALCSAAANHQQCRIGAPRLARALQVANGSSRFKRITGPGPATSSCDRRRSASSAIRTSWRCHGPKKCSLSSSATQAWQAPALSRRFACGSETAGPTGHVSPQGAVGIDARHAPARAPIRPAQRVA